MALAVSYDDFLGWRDFADIFGDRAQSLVEDYLADAEADCPAGVWTTKQSRSIKLLTAHRLTIAQSVEDSSGFVGGQISSMSVSQGSQSLSFGGVADSTLGGEQLARTVYGQEYLELRKRLPVVGFVV